MSAHIFSQSDRRADLNVVSFFICSSLYGEGRGMFPASFRLAVAYWTASPQNSKPERITGLISVFAASESNFRFFVHHFSLPGTCCATVPTRIASIIGME